MTGKYYGKKIVKDKFGHIIDRYQPCVTILCKLRKKQGLTHPVLAILTICLPISLLGTLMKKRIFWTHIAEPRNV